MPVRLCVFRVNSARAVQGDGMTQFGSLHALNIDILCANTPQGKRRVERANKTLQDRLVKEMRLQGISTIAAGNDCGRVSWPITTPGSARSRATPRTRIGHCRPAMTSPTSSLFAKSGRFAVLL
jgi:hypothetical protein